MRDFFADKAVDCVFIFLGVYVAFVFSDWQEDERKRKELEFNVEQILRDLPQKAPQLTFENIKFNEYKEKNGRCTVWLPPMNLHYFQAGDYVKTITNRGLGTYLGDSRTLSQLISLYNDWEKRFKDELISFSEDMEGDPYIKELRQKRKNRSKNENIANSCLENEEIKKYLFETYNDKYREIRRLDIQINHYAFELAQALKELGYSTPDSKGDVTFYALKSKANEMDTNEVIIKKIEGKDKESFNEKPEEVFADFIEKEGERLRIDKDVKEASLK